jgi:hypothetical protein
LIQHTQPQSHSPAGRDRGEGTVSRIDRHGGIPRSHATLHARAFDNEATLTPGEGFYVCACDPGRGEIPIGMMSCFDREFPESDRMLMLKGT